METEMISIPFDLELAKKITNGEVEGKVVTRDGRNARIVCWDRADKIYPIVGLCNYPNSDNEIVYSYTKDGYFDHTKKGYNQDLMLKVPEYMTFKDGDIVAFGESPIFIGILKDNWPHSRCHTDYVVLNDVGELIYVENYWIYENARIATEEERQKLIDALKSSKEPQANEYLKRFFGIEEKPKCEFKPFDKVLVRDLDFNIWYNDIFSFRDKDGKYMCIGEKWDECIPYNEETAHLLGTTDNFEDNK